MMVLCVCCVSAAAGACMLFACVATGAVYVVYLPAGAWLCMLCLVLCVSAAGVL